MAVPKFITNDMKGGSIGGPTTPVRRGYVGSGLVYQGFSPASEQEFIEQTAAGGPAQLLKVYGKTIVWNQQVQPFNKSERVSQGATFSITNGVLTIVCPSGTTGDVLVSSYISEDDLGFRQQDGHLYYSPNTLPQGLRFAKNVYGNGIALCNDSIQTGRDSSTTQQQWSLVSVSGTIISQAVSCPIRVIDLTLLYGEGHEPTSVAQFLADYPEYDPTYDPGSLQSNKTAELRAERIPVINVWDEEWEVGLISGSTGQPIPGSDYIRAKNFCPCLPNTAYYARISATHQVRLYWYDASQGFISAAAAVYEGGVLTTPANCYYFKLITWDIAYGTTYRNDICFNLSDPAINGTYYPHWRGSLTLNLSTLTGKLNGEGASVVVFPDGLKAAGSVRDEIVGNTAIKRVGVVDLGTLTWNKYTNAHATDPTDFYRGDGITDGKNGVNLTFPNIISDRYKVVRSLGINYYTTQDNKSVSIENSSQFVLVFDSAYSTAADLKTALEGSLLYYELATPQTYTLDTPLPTDLTCEQGDILQRVSDNNCPFVGEMRFGL